MTKTNFPADTKEDRALQLVALDKLLMCDMTEEANRQASRNRAELVAVMVAQDGYVEPTPVESGPPEQGEVGTPGVIKGQELLHIFEDGVRLYKIEDTWYAYTADEQVIGSLETVDYMRQYQNHQVSHGLPAPFNSEPIVDIAGYEEVVAQNPLVQLTADLLPQHTFEDGVKLYLVPTDGGSNLVILMNQDGSLLNNTDTQARLDAVKLLIEKKEITLVTDTDSTKINAARETLHHTFEDGVQMYVGGDLHPTGARFLNADGTPVGDLRGKYSGYEAELKAVGKTMTPIRDAQDANRGQDQSGAVSAEVPPGTPTIKPKYALCIPAWQRFVPRSEWTPVLKDRHGPNDFCEKTTDFLQILPYITVQDRYGRIFNYLRAAGGDEKGLVNLRSVGGGGHIDTDVPELSSYLEPGEAFVEGTSALDLHIAHDAKRELMEEFGLDVPVSELMLALEESFIMYFPKTDVDARHLAISMTITVADPAQLTAMEAGHIEDPQWIDRQFAQLQTMVADMVKPEAILWKFETWSAMYLHITSNGETLSSYMQQMDALQQRFRLQQKIVDLWSRDVVAKFPDTQRLVIHVDNGTSLCLEGKNGEPNQQVRVPSAPFIGIHVGETQLDDEKGTTVPLYTWAIDEVTSYRTTDFKDWEGPLSLTGEVPSPDLPF